MARKLRNGLVGLAAIAFVATASAGLASFNAKADSDAVFEINATAVRTVTPSGLRFKTVAPVTPELVAQYPDAECYTKISFVSEVEGEATTYSANVPATVWRPEGDGWNTVLLDIPASDYATEITAQSFIKLNDTTTYETVAVTTSIAKTAANAMNAGETSELVTKYVENVVTDIKLDATASIAAIGETTKLTATTTPAGYAVVWASDNEAVAKVAADGTVTAIGIGTANITATMSGVTKTCVVSVGPEWAVNAKVSASGTTALTEEGQVVFKAGTTGAGHPHDVNGSLGYIAYNGNYGAGDYVVVDFTGNNMPAVKFFAQELTDDLLNANDTKTVADQGVVFLNGYINASGTGGWKRDGVYAIGGHGITNIGLNGTANNNAQYQTINFDNSPLNYGALALAERNTTKYRMIVGFNKADQTGASIDFAMINLDTCVVEWQRTFAYTIAQDPANYVYSGAIQVYGHYSKVITLDKAYAVEEDTTFEALLTKYTPEVPNYLEDWMTQNNVTGSGIATTTPAGGLTFEAGSTGGANPANADGSLGYLAYNGSYGAGDYVVVDFTGNNMPAIQFLRTVVADDYINGENQQLDKHKGVLMFNGHLKSTGDGGWKTDSLYVTGMYSLVNIGGNDKFNPQQYRMLAISPDYGFADLANSSKSYRMMAGLSAIGSEIVLSIAIVDLADNTLEYSVDYNFTHNVDMATFGTEGIIQIFGRYGTTTTLDKVYAIEENTNLEALYTKYNVVVPTNDPALAPMQAWLTENNIQAAGVASTTADRKVVFGAGVAGAGHPHDANGALGYLAYDGSYGANDFVVVDFTGNNLPTIQFLRTVIADDYFNPENAQLDKHKGVLFCNGHLNASGTGGWKRDNLWVSGMYGITNIGGGDNFNPQQNRLFSVADDFGFEDLKDSTTKYRMIVGLTSLENGKLSAHLVIINLDTGAVAVNNAFEMGHNVADMAAFGKEGIIQIFGQYGKTTTLDKVYAIEENTTMAALLQKYTPAV